MQELTPSFSSSVTQLSDIKKQKARLEALKREAEEEKERAREAARERVLLEFERGQLGLAAPTAVATTSGAGSAEGACIQLFLLCMLSVI